MLFHFNFANYFRMIRLAAGERNPAARFYFLTVLLLALPLISTFHAICFFLDGILFPGLWKTEIRTPVFERRRRPRSTRRIRRTNRPPRRRRR